eukprot:6118199-Amphidinium_carterae.1
MPFRVHCGRCCVHKGGCSAARCSDIFPSQVSMDIKQHTPMMLSMHAVLSCMMYSMDTSLEQGCYGQEGLCFVTLGTLWRNDSIGIARWGRCCG